MDLEVVRPFHPVTPPPLLLPLKVLAAVMLASCSSPASRTATSLTEKTIQELTAYEQEVENKINREKGFYTQQSLNLLELEGFSVLPKKGSAEAGPGQPTKSPAVAGLEDRAVAQHQNTEAKEGLQAKAAEGDPGVREELQEAMKTANENAGQAAKAANTARAASAAAGMKAGNLGRELREINEALRKAEEGLTNDPNNAALRAQVAEKVSAKAAKETELAAAKAAKEVAQTAMREADAKQKAAEKEISDAEQELAKEAETAAPPVAADDEAGARVRRSLAYLRIHAASKRDAIATTDKLLAQGLPITRTVVTDYLYDGIVEDTAYVEKAVQSRQLLQTDLLKSLTQLNAGKSNLGAVRDALTKVKEKKSFLKRVEDLLRFGRKTRDEFNSRTQTSP